jgi:hypothetical protein
LKNTAAPDGLTWAGYGDDLEANLRDLHTRVHRGAYRALASRRRYIPKADGRQRPLGIGTHQANCTQPQPTFGFYRSNSSIPSVARPALRRSEGPDGIWNRDLEPPPRGLGLVRNAAGLDRLGTAWFPASFRR